MIITVCTKGREAEARRIAEAIRKIPGVTEVHIEKEDHA